MAAAISLYLDEQLSPRIAEQLKRKGITAVTVRDLGFLGDPDEKHLARATEMGYVLCTADADYLKLSADGIEHAGIVYGVQGAHSIGEWVNALELICSVYTPEEMKNHIEYL